jgi:hypothetical protein
MAAKDTLRAVYDTLLYYGIDYLTFMWLQIES